MSGAPERWTMSLHVLKKGLDVPIAGEVTGNIVDLPVPASVSVAPRDLPGITPRILSREGASVKVGTALFADKAQPDLRLVSAAAGEVREIVRGPRRVVLDHVVSVTGDAAESFRQWDLGALKKISRDEARIGLGHGGLWPVLRCRPLDKVPAMGSTPQWILVSATETGPLAPGADLLLGAGDGEALQAGLYVLKALTPGAVAVAVPQGTTHPALANLKDVDVHQFGGPHPSGDPSVQINHIAPPTGNGQVWYARAWDVALIGRLFLEGRYPAQRVYTAAGTGLAAPRAVRTLCGAPIRTITGDAAPGPVRWILGSVLTGQVVDPERWAGFTNRMFTVIPDRAERRLFGWTAPNLGDFSYHRAFLSGFLGAGGRKVMDTGLRGGVRSMVPVGYYRGVVATPDIEPEFLFRSIIAGDLEESVKLGLLDLSMEEAALLTYVCPSKIEFDVILRDGLALYEKEA